MQKNIASQKWVVFAFDRTDNTPKTGDAANITANIQIDFAAAAGTNDLNPTELEDGYYSFDLTQAETNGDQLVIYPASGTADIQVIGVPGAIFTSPASFPDNVVQTGDTYALANGSTGFVAIDTVVDSILLDTGTDGVEISATIANKIADHIIRRSLSTALASSDGDTKAFRSLAGAISKLVNKIAISGSTLTIYEDDDTTSLGTQNLTTDAAADPITGADTV